MSIVVKSKVRQEQDWWAPQAEKCSPLAQHRSKGGGVNLSGQPDPQNIRAIQITAAEPDPEAQQ
jgi:hypothetical protein